MPSSNKSKKKKSKTHQSTGKKELSAVSLQYSGPIRVRADAKAEDLATINLHYSGFLTSTAAAVINTVWSNDPGYAADWSNFYSIYSEYRVLGMEVMYYPSNRYSKTTTACTPILGVIDRVSATPLSSITQAMAYDSARVLSLEDPWSFKLYMQGSDEAVFVDTTSITVNQSIKLYGDNLSVSTNYGRILIYYLVQFRGRK